MVWNVDYHGDLQIVVLTFSGEITGPELLEAAASRIELGQEKGATKFLIDAAEMIAPTSTTLAVLEMPARMYLEKNMERTSRIAVLIPTDPESRWIAEFYENASVNRGWHVKLFTDRNGAIDWL
jgi:hypothetical protein